MLKFTFRPNPKLIFSAFSRLFCFGLLSLILPVVAPAQAGLLHAIPPPPVGIQPGGQFGYSVAVDGPFTVVGAPYDDLGGQDSGTVRVFNSESGALLLLLRSPAPVAGGLFGLSVAISGNRVVIGTPKFYSDGARVGCAFVYDLGSAAPTVPVYTLSNPTPVHRDEFGHSVAISGTRVVVGDWFDSTGSLNAGRAYVYDLSTGTPTVPLATLNNPGPATGDFFGGAVAISGQRVVVGAYNDDTSKENAGSVYVYDLGNSSPSIPVESLSNPAARYFGNSVALSGNLLVVGAPGTLKIPTLDSGSAYVYDLDAITPTVAVATLDNPSPATSDNFGNAVALSGLNVLIGAALDDFGGFNSGLAYIFNLASAAPTVPSLLLSNPGPGAGDGFGGQVAISGSRVAIGAPLDDSGASDAGSAYLYDLSSATPTVPGAALSFPGPLPGDQFGSAVALSGSKLLVGAPYDDVGAPDSGSAYLYDLASATPNVPVLVIPNPAPAAGDLFGYAIAMAGNRVVVGASSDDAGATDAGSVYVYDLGSANPTVPVAALPNPGPASGDLFGSAVAISGTQVVVGAYGDAAGGLHAGSAYVYDLGSGTPGVPILTLNNPSPAAEDWFGYAVAISGKTLVIGANQDDSGATDAGSAYVYDLSSGAPAVPVLTWNTGTPSPSVKFGHALAISGNRVAVGVGGSSPRVYVFDLGSSTPGTAVTTVNNPSNEGGNRFGSSVALSGPQLVVGARLSDVAGVQDVGQAYVFDLSGATPGKPMATLDHPRPVFNNQFGSAVAIDGFTVAVGTPFDDEVMADKGYTYLFSSAPPPTGPLLRSGVTIRSVSSEFTAAPWALIAAHLVDGSGLSGTPPVHAQNTVTQQNSWQSSSPTGTAAVEFDLGAVVPLHHLHVWNLNFYAPYNGRGARAVRISTSLDAATWTTVEPQVEFPMATGLDGDPGFEFCATTWPAARYVRFEILSNWGGNDNAGLVGLSEVRFYTVNPAAPTFTITRLERLAQSNEIALTFPASAGLRYVIEWSGDLADWHEATTVEVPADNIALRVALPGQALETRRYFRVRNCPAPPK